MFSAVILHNMQNGLQTVGWLACVVYSTIPAFWLMIHPFADRWRASRRSPYRLLVPLWMAMWVVVALITERWRQVALYQTPWAWTPAVLFFAVGLYLYSRSGKNFSPKQLGGLPEVHGSHGEQRLVTEGIRGRVRHPVYLAHLCEMLAWSLGTGLVVCWGLTAFAMVTGAVMIRMEDAELEERFGSEYTVYRGNVPAVLPALRGRRGDLSCLTLMLPAVMIAYSCLVSAQTQVVVGSSATQSEVVLMKLSPPIYPPLARQARISGDVEVKLGIRKDGSVETAVAASGHPMLQPAALDSAQKSLVECRGCRDDVTPFSIIYTFRFAACRSSAPNEPSRLEVTQLGNQVTITAEPEIMHIDFANVAVRSAKCLYMWRCGSFWSGSDYYYYRVRSPRCLYLWKCGFHRRPPAANRCQQDSIGDTR